MLVIVAFNIIMPVADIYTSVIRVQLWNFFWNLRNDSEIKNTGRMQQYLVESQHTKCGLGNSVYELVDQPFTKKQTKINSLVGKRCRLSFAAPYLFKLLTVELQKHDIDVFDKLCFSANF